MDGLTIATTTSPDAVDIARLGEGLAEHSLAYTNSAGFLPIAVFARAAQDRLRGGIYAYVNWNWLQIQLVWVDSELRHGGLGSQLLRAIEAAGIERGCRLAHLDTMGYQARPFYEKHGYELFAQLEDYPPGFTRHFMRKKLVDNG